ncbi:PKD domain-containing protein [Parafrankia irregularis]|uniref:PKD domain-containing protein n=1 Tax=Parafrankia irregularis TaxID=795642 RepID=A0A0S4QEJ0_9ACTN|nr:MULTISPECIES: PKD domain-containing protein [Parafrankia]MBE3203326.1 PKD domain-containing protein [Parafrankia sp. CH37]CUU54027.1 PKD domain-containing protein [Parafrankia irregularis]
MTNLRRPPKVRRPPNVRGPRKVPRPRNMLRVVVALALLAGGAVLVGQAGGVPGRLLAVEDGAAWLVSSATGQAALVDGASSQVVTKVAVGSGDLTSAQSGPDAYVVNRTAGSVLRIDGATYEASEPVRFGSGQRQLRVFPTSAATYVVDEESGLVTTADPGTLQARSLQSVAARAGSGSAVTDSSGRLWLIDRDNGDLVRLDEHGGKGRTRAGVAASSQLVLAGDRPAVVDPAARTVHAVGDTGGGGGASGDDASGGGASGDDASGGGGSGGSGSDGGGAEIGPDASTCLETTATDRSVVILGSTSRPVVYAASGQHGTLVISNLATGRCDTVVDLAAAGHDLGQPREAAGRVFLPDFTDGHVIVVDVDQRRVVARPEVLPAGTRFELVTQGPFIFFNDPSSFRAGAIRLDGSVRVIEKYNPDRPGDGLAGGSATSGAGAGDSSTDGGAQPATAPLPDTAPSPRISDVKNTSDGAETSDPEVTIQVSAVRVRIGQPVTLRLAARDGTRIAGATWSFGDGTTGSGSQASHAWSQLGNYLVVAHAVLADGRRATPAVHLTVDRRGTPSVENAAAPPGTAPIDAPPTNLLVARLTVTPASGEAPLHITADASGSTAGTAPIAGYAFDFGDGTAAGGPGAAASATHTYESAQPGATFVVSATVTDQAGNTSRASQQVTIIGSGAPAVPTMTVTAAGDRWRVEAAPGTGGAPTARFGLTADRADVQVTPITERIFDVIPSTCDGFNLTLTAYAADGTETPANPQVLDPGELDPQSVGLCAPEKPVLEVQPADGFGFSVVVKDPVTDGSVTYAWSYTDGGGGAGFSVQPQADRISFRTTDCSQITVTVTATGTGGALTSDPVTGMGCTTPAAVVITGTVVGTQITWTLTPPTNTYVEQYSVSQTFPGVGGQDAQNSVTTALSTTIVVDGVLGGTYGITVEARNAAGSSTAHDEVTLDSGGPPPTTTSPPPSETTGPPETEPTTPTPEPTTPTTDPSTPTTEPTTPQTTDPPTTDPEPIPDPPETTEPPPAPTPEPTPPAGG